MKNNNIIVAQATANGVAPLAIVRLSGSDIRILLNSVVVFKSKKKLIDIASHNVCYGYINDCRGNIIDQIMLVAMDSPRSFTGEDTIEITCHNNQFIINKIIATCIALGARMADRGEFSQRAVANKKIDIFQAEAINELLHAQNELITEIALAQVEGSLSSQIQYLDNELCIISAWCQASFEFLDEERDFRLIILEKLENVILKIEHLLRMHSTVKFLKEGVRVAIIGSVNVGKSSLFNALLGYKRAIVSNTAGTTRDTIEAGLFNLKYTITLIDTAGIRLTNDEIENEGIEKSYYEAELADILLLVYEDEVLENKDVFHFYNCIKEKYDSKIIFIKNKIDRQSKEVSFFGELLISTKENIGINNVLNKIYENIENKLENRDVSYIINVRHVENLKGIKEVLFNVKDLLYFESPYYEIVLYNLLEAQKIISNLSGKSIEERSLDKVFKEFCVGK